MRRKRFANCACEGRLRDKWGRWGVLERGTGASPRSKLKCLACGWKWNSRCKYVAKLPDHVERSRRGLTHEGILERLRDGTLRIDPHTAIVESCLRYGRRQTYWTPLRQIEDSKGGGYRFVEVSVSGMKRKIGVHVLQWMAAHNCLVPDDCEVNHKRSPARPAPKPNHIDNLELLFKRDNRSADHFPEFADEFDEVPF